jgi:hypothetical protein
VAQAGRRCGSAPSDGASAESAGASARAEGASAEAAGASARAEDASAEAAGASAEGAGSSAQAEGTDPTVSAGACAEAQAPAETEIAPLFDLQLNARGAPAADAPADGRRWRSRRRRRPSRRRRAAASDAPAAYAPSDDAVCAPVACPASCCQKVFTLDAGVARAEAVHSRAKAAAAHMRQAVAGHGAHAPGLSYSRMAQLQVVWCPFCRHPQVRSSAKEGYL